MNVISVDTAGSASYGLSSAPGLADRLRFLGIDYRDHRGMFIQTCLSVLPRFALLLPPSPVLAVHPRPRPALHCA